MPGLGPGTSGRVSGAFSELNYDPVHKFGASPLHFPDKQ